MNNEFVFFSTSKAFSVVGAPSLDVAELFVRKNLLASDLDATIELTPGRNLPLGLDLVELEFSRITEILDRDEVKTHAEGSVRPVSPKRPVYWERDAIIEPSCVLAPAEFIDLSVEAILERIGTPHALATLAALRANPIEL